MIRLRGKTERGCTKKDDARIRARVSGKNGGRILVPKATGPKI